MNAVTTTIAWRQGRICFLHSNSSLVDMTTAMAAKNQMTRYFRVTAMARLALIVLSGFTGLNLCFQ